MKKFVYLIIFIFSHQAFAQIGTEEFDSNINPGVEIRQIPQRKKELLGSTFLFENWTVGDVYLNSGTVLRDIPLKYDILGQDLLILQNDRLLGVKLNFVDEFNLLSSTGEELDFLVTKDWTINGEPGTGVYQRLTTNGKFGLIKITKVQFIKANYYVALDAGQKDDEYVKVEDLYFVNNSTKDLFKVPRSKKKIIGYFGNEEIHQFIKTNRLDFRTEEGLIKLIEFVNDEGSNGRQEDTE